ncbi:MAG: hypothetical protein C0500_14535 [Sphingobium sp.]|nr:hypothetical protein [Sphingobium sp.]
MKTSILPFAAALLVAAPAAAHAPAIGPHGGLRLHWGAYHVELVPAGKRTELYLMRAKDDAPVPSSGTSASAKILAGGRIITASFAPAGGNRLIAPIALSGDWRANVSVRLPVGSATLLFTARAAGAARHAGH